ncbi:hypothetical protein [Sphingomonas sp.]|nr:hypothetical protein [Sphingomonas sp.]
MNQWAFVSAAYAVVILGSVGVALVSWLAMRKAEAAADALGRRE